MLLALLLLQAAVASPPPPPLPQTYSGWAHQLAVSVPQLDDSVVVDGALTEPAWSHAARLTGFSEFLPVDGRLALDSTEVLIWYAPDAIYIGVHAYEAHGPVHATLADRDNIGADDYVQILLDTFNDRRHAYVFGANPLGVQADGTLTEGIQSHSAGIGSAGAARDTVDLSTDYIYTSRGRITPGGYDVEMRIPLKSIRFQTGHVQRWGINVIRHVQHSGDEDTWAPTLQSSSSFLAQSGTLVGLTGLTRGHVLEINPELTSHVNGAPVPQGWRYDARTPELGGNLRYTLTENLTADATVKPDFSQVEADVPQLVYDPRSAIFYPEKRPFFLDGLEQFATPSKLVYTRRIVQPSGAVKLTGTAGGFDIGLLSAVDDDAASASGQTHPVFNILRLRRQAGRSLSIGGVYTDREEGGAYNRVAGVDARLLFSNIYSLRVQGAASTTHQNGTTAGGPLWNAVFERNGHTVRLRYSLSGIDPDFATQSGYVSRSGVAQGSLGNSITLFGKPGHFFESWTGDFTANRTWQYTHFVDGRAAEDVRWHLSNKLTFRGGWVAVANIFLESYGYDPSLYSNYYLAQPAGDTVPFVGMAHIPNLDIVTGLSTPHWARFDASIQTITGRDENFYEWASANIVFIDASVNWRPSDRARINALYSQQQYIRRTDGSTVGLRRIPRLKVEYQLSRPIFIRLVGTYDSQIVDSLRDDSRTNDPIVYRDPATGTFTRAAATTTNSVRMDFLFAYQPTPGTVFFLGYGSSMGEDDPFALRGLHRTSDGFFAKLSYVFRLGD